MKNQNQGLPARAMGKNNEEKVNLVKNEKNAGCQSGEKIALRIIRTAKEVVSTPWRSMKNPTERLTVLRFADEAIMIGDGPRKDYLNIDKIIWRRKIGSGRNSPRLRLSVGKSGAGFGM